MSKRGNRLIQLYLENGHQKRVLMNKITCKTRNDSLVTLFS